MGGAAGLRAARGERFGRGLSRAAREQPATVGVGPARTLGGVLRDPRGTRTANGRRVRPHGSCTRLEPSSANRPHPGLINTCETNKRLSVHFRSVPPRQLNWHRFCKTIDTSPLL